MKKLIFKPRMLLKYPPDAFKQAALIAASLGQAVQVNQLARFFGYGAPRIEDWLSSWQFYQEVMALQARHSVADLEEIQSLWKNHQYEALRAKLLAHVQKAELNERIRLGLGNCVSS